MTENYQWHDLIGFDEDSQKLQGLIQERRLPPVLLFSGKEGIGKCRFATKIFAFFYCKKKNACGTCSHCLTVANNAHPNVRMVSSSTITTQEVEGLKEHLTLKPSQNTPQGQYNCRGVVIADAQHMTLPATNKLLKSLEELPESTQVILTTSCYRNLPKTLLSRCVTWHLQPPSIDALKEWLLQKKFSSKNIEGLIKRCHYSPARILRALERSVVKTTKPKKELSSMQLLPLLPNWVKQLPTNFSKPDKENISCIIEEIELSLNEMYKNEKAHSIREIKVRRQKLHQVKRLIIQEKIPLNTQFILETLGLIAKRMKSTPRIT